MVPSPVTVSKSPLWFFSYTSCFHFIEFFLVMENSSTQHFKSDFLISANSVSLKSYSSSEKVIRTILGWNFLQFKHILPFYFPLIVNTHKKSPSSSQSEADLPFQQEIREDNFLSCEASSRKIIQWIVLAAVHCNSHCTIYCFYDILSVVISTKTDYIYHIFNIC